MLSLPPPMPLSCLPALNSLFDQSVALSFCGLSPALWLSLFRAVVPTDSASIPLWTLDNAPWINVNIIVCAAVFLPLQFHKNTWIIKVQSFIMYNPTGRPCCKGNVLTSSGGKAFQFYYTAELNVLLTFTVLVLIDRNHKTNKIKLFFYMRSINTVSAFEAAIFRLKKRCVPKHFP